MRTGSELSGLAVVSATAGERLGRVQDVVFDIKSGRVTGFLVDTGGMFSKPRFLPRLVVRSLGADALIVEGGTNLEENAPEGESSVFAARSLDGRAVLSEDGAAIGKVADVIVDPDGLTIPELVLATGFLDNTLHGKPHLPLSLIHAAGPDSLVVSREYSPKEAPAPPAA